MSQPLMTTRQAYEFCNCGRTWFLAQVEIHGIEPASQVPTGVTGAKLWNRSDVETIKAAVITARS